MSKAADVEVVLVLNVELVQMELLTQVVALVVKDMVVQTLLKMVVQELWCFAIKLVKLQELQKQLARSSRADLPEPKIMSERSPALYRFLLLFVQKTPCRA